MRSRPDAHFRNLEETALVREAFIAERLDHHFGGLDEAFAGFVHRDAKALILEPRRTASETNQQPSMRQNVEHRDLLGNAYRTVPGQDDNRGAEVNPRRP